MAAGAVALARSQSGSGKSDGGKMPAVERALSALGTEESLAQTAHRFAEHDGWEIGRRTMRRVVERVAQEAATYVEPRLAA